LAGAVFALTSAEASAQDAPGGNQQLETVTVTGSRIRKADVETAQPIVVLDRAAIEHQGFNSIADILQNLSEAGSPPISRAQPRLNGEDVGGYYIDLRNLGNNRTLVLLNGKRLGATTSGAQDLSQIPMSAIERVEVLKDGASAIYGSDAIAGVVNIITRKNYDGAEASAYVGQYDQDDGAKQTYSMTLGSHNERGSITVSAEYSKEDPTWAKDRPWSAYPNSSRHPMDGLSPYSQYGVVFFPDGTCPGQDLSPFGGCTLNPGGNPFNPRDYHGTNSAGGGSDMANAAEQMTGTTGIERRALFVNGEYAITDSIKFSTDILYNKRSTMQQGAGYPYQSALSKDSYYNPFGVWHVQNPDDATSLKFWRRTWEAPRTVLSDLQTYRFSGTLSGTFELAGRNWDWDVGGYVNTNDVMKTSHGDLNRRAADNALGPSFYDPVSGRVVCGTKDKPLPYGSGPGQCVPWNPIYGYGSTGPGALSGDPTLQKYLFPFYHDTGRTKTVDYSANVTGSIFTLPAGDLGIAAGFEHRNESGSFVPDAFAQSGLSTTLAGGPTSGKYTVDEYYVELDVPVLKDLPLAKQLSFNIAGRYSDYDTFGNTTNGKFSLTWKPIDDLLVRGNYAQGFRAPTVSDLYGGSSQSFDDYADPCDTAIGSAAHNAETLRRCTQGIGGQRGLPSNFRQPGQGGAPCTVQPCPADLPILHGSNPNLKPETATSRTLGLVYSPKWIQGLDLSLDWYRIRINNVVSSDDLSQMLNDCYVLGVASRCAQFTRDDKGRINGAIIGSVNKGWTEVQGYDLGVNYRLPEFSFGRFALHWDTTYVDYNNVKPDNKPETPVVVQNSLGGFPRIRSTASLDWTLGDFGATWTARYYSSMKSECSYDINGGPECNQPGRIAPDTGAKAFNRYGANTFHDVQVRWTAPWNASIALGANNVFNHVGPIMYAGTDSEFKYYGGFDIGRFYYLRYTQKF
jgi:iron complex outermembrane receptor protein